MRKLDNVDIRSFADSLKFWFHIITPPQRLWFHLESSEKFISRNM